MGPTALVPNPDRLPSARSGGGERQDSCPPAVGGGGPHRPQLHSAAAPPNLLCVHRVKVALAKKEEAVSSLRKQHQVGPQQAGGWDAGRGGGGLT